MIVRKSTKITNVMEFSEKEKPKIFSYQGFNFDPIQNTKAPNGGKCPHCKDGHLYWSRETSYATYYKCGKCGSEVKA